jgi:hypothetical protein
MVEREADAIRTLQRSGYVSSIFIAKLHEDIDKQSLIDMFEDYGTILRCDGNIGGSAFIHFEHEKNADSAIAARHGTLIVDQRVELGHLVGSVLESQEPQIHKMLAERLHPLIECSQPERAGQIASDMLREMKRSEVLALLDSPERLQETISKAVKVLEEDRDRLPQAAPEPEPVQPKEAEPVPTAPAVRTVRIPADRIESASSSWTSAQLANAVCDRLVETDKLRATPASIRQDRQDRITSVFTDCSLDGEKMRSFEFPRNVEILLRGATEGEPWVDDVQNTLVDMLSTVFWSPQLPAGHAQAVDEDTLSISGSELSSDNMTITTLHSTATAAIPMEQSLHIQQRMNEREVSELDVKHAIKHGDVYENAGKHTARATRYGIADPEKLLLVITDASLMTGITVMPFTSLQELDAYVKNKLGAEVSKEDRKKIKAGIQSAVDRINKNEKQMADCFHLRDVARVPDDATKTGRVPERDVRHTMSSSAQVSDGVPLASSIPESAAAPVAIAAPAAAPAPAPAFAPAPALEWESVAEWLNAKKLAMCADALAEAGYDEELEMVVEGDNEEVGDMIVAVETIVGVKKPTVKKFKRALAEVRGQGETFA